MITLSYMTNAHYVSPIFHKNAKDYNSLLKDCKIDSEMIDVRKIIIKYVVIILIIL